MALCASCGSWAGSEDWRKLCKRCYARQKEAEEAQLMQLQEELSLLRLQLSAVTRHNQELQASLSARLLNFAIPEERLRKLIQLCHPDKHGGSAAATETTQWLNSLRDRIK